MALRHTEGLSHRPILTMDPFLTLHPQLPRQMYPLEPLPMGVRSYPYRPYPRGLSTPGPYWAMATGPRTYVSQSFWSHSYSLCFFFPEAQNCFLKRPTVSFSPAPWPPATLSGAQNVPGVPGALPLYGLCSTAPHSWHQQWLTPGTTGDSGSPGPSSRTLMTVLL